MINQSSYGLQHNNGHLLCAIDCETTGQIPGKHDLIQIAILPLDSELNPLKTITPFYTDIKPKRPENVEPEAMRSNRLRICEASTRGIDPYFAADLFEEWFQKLGLGFEKRIMPLASNWPFDRGFVIDWLGQLTFDHHFDARYRDTQVAALYENDKADFAQEPYPYQKVSLKYICSTHKIENERAHDALADAYATSRAYRAIIRGIKP